MPLPLRVGFAGTPDFAATALAALLDAGFTIPLVLTRADRPKGRGLKLEPSPVRRLAEDRGVAVLTPPTLRSAEARAPLAGFPLDVLVVAAYGLILPQEVLDWPRHGCLNIHASRLPRWRGAAPIQRAILAGDAATGVSVMRMDAGLDTGPVVDVVDVPIGPRETAGTLHDRLADAGARAMVETLGRLARDGTLPATPQPDVGATYAAKIESADAAIDWSAESQLIDRQVRAFDPVPGAFSALDGQRIKIWAVQPRSPSEPLEPGRVASASAAGIDVACGPEGRGRLRVLALQPAGARRMPAGAFLAGRGLPDSARFVTPAT